MVERKTFLLKTERGEREVGRGDEVLMEYTEYTGYDGATRVHAERIVRVTFLRDQCESRPDSIQTDWSHLSYTLDGRLLGRSSDEPRLHPLTPEVRVRYERAAAWETVLSMSESNWYDLFDEDILAIAKIIRKRRGDE